MSFANDAFLRRAIVGQLTELTFPENWAQFGLLSVDDTLALVHDALDTLSLICLPEVPTMYVHVSRSTNMTASPNVITKLTGLSVVHNTGEWDAANQRVNIAEDGLYIGQYRMSAPNNQSEIAGWFYVNDAAAYGTGVPLPQGWNFGLTRSFIMPLSSGDFVDARGRHDNGAEIGTTSGVIAWLIFRLGDLA